MSTAKSPKLPAPFKAEFTKTDFEKKILKRIHVKGEAEFAQSLYKIDSQRRDVLVFSAEMDKPKTKHLKTLAKAIKRNRGFVSWGKLAILGVLVVGFIAFNLFFKNSIVTGVLESSLQGVFGAKVDVRGLDFDPLGGKITLTELVVADKGQPMRNLFQLGQTGMVVDMWQALNGRILIKLLQCKDVRFGTERSISGALASPVATPAPTPTPAPANGANPVNGFIDLGKLDAKSLVAGQLDKLESVQLAKSVEQEFGALTDTAKTSSGELQGKVKNLANSAAERIAGNLAQVRSQEDLNAAIAKSTDFKAEINVLQKEADNSAKKLKDLQKTYESKLKQIEASAKRDQANLGKMVSQPQGTGGALANQALEQVMGPRARELLDLAARIPKVLASLNQGNEKPPTPERRQGRVVDFPVPQHPKFQISHIEGSVWWSQDVQLAMTVDNISSDQTITGAPTTFMVSFGSNAISFNLKGSVDLRPKAKYQLTMDGGMRGLQVALGKELEFIGLQSVKGKAKIEGTYRLDPQGNAKVKADAGLSAIKSQVVTGSMIGRICQASLDSLGNSVNGQLQLGLKANGEFSFDLQSGLDAALDSGVQKAIDGELKKMSKEIADQLQAQIDQALGAERGKQLRQLVADNAGDIKTLKDLQKQADQRSADLQKISKLLGANPADLGKNLNGLKLPGF